MYKLATLILMAILLGAVMPVFHSIMHTLKLDTIINRIPIIKDHVTLGVSILLVWALNVELTTAWFAGAQSIDMRYAWVHICVDGCIVYGMVPVKDAIVQFISRGITGLRAA